MPSQASPWAPREIYEIFEWQREEWLACQSLMTTPDLSFSIYRMGITRLPPILL